jgi:hypothetical protein
MNTDFCNVCVGSFREITHNTGFAPWIPHVKRLLMPFSFENYRHRRYFSSQKRSHDAHYRHQRYIFGEDHWSNLSKKLIFGGGVVLPTWTLQITDMDVIFTPCITDTDVAKYRHGRCKIKCHYRHGRCKIPTWTLFFLL